MAVRRASSFAIIAAAIVAASGPRGGLCSEAARPSPLVAQERGLPPAATKNISPPPPVVKASSITPVPWTPVLVKTVLTPQVFRGSDGKAHIVYDLILQNSSSQSAVVNKLELLNGNGSLIRAIDQKHLITCMVGPLPFVSPQVIPGGGTAVTSIVLDFQSDTDAPNVIRHRVTVTTLDTPMIHGEQKTWTYEAAPTVVDKRQPVIIGAPVSGGNWLALGGYAGLHGAPFAVGNAWQSASCYASDWTRLDDSYRPLSHDQNTNENSLSYGQPVFAVADGTIIGANDHVADQPPGRTDFTDFDYPEGNAIVEDIGNDLYVVYEHLRPGSLKVKEGQRVKRGQPIAQVGNSGWSLKAHLQMQVVDAPHPIAANGVPYLFDSFKVVGEVQDVNKARAADAGSLQQLVGQTAACGDHKHELPREGSVIVFPELQTH